MKLEVGKEYRARNGDKVKIVKYDSLVWHPYLSNKRSYLEDGRYVKWATEHDLISEWNEENMTTETETEIKKLREQLERLEAVHAAEQKAKKGGVFVPKKGEDYWFIDSDYGIACASDWDNSSFDRCNLEMGNAYRTEEEAEQVVTNRKIHTFLRMQMDFVADWSDEEQDKYYLIYDCSEGEFDYGARSFMSLPTQVFFRSRADLDKARNAAISKFGHDNVKSYLTRGVM